MIDGIYEHRSVALTIPSTPAASTDSSPLATVAVDRFMHYAAVVLTEGDCYRFVQSRDGQGYP